MAQENHPRGPSADLTNGALKGAMPEGKAPDPETHRFVQTRTGTVSIPRKKEGIPFKDFFGNTRLPDDLSRAQVHQTAKGYVVLEGEAQGWTQDAAEKAKTHAGELRTLIDEKGYYRKNLTQMAGRMADHTGMPREDMQAVIVREFENLTGRDPYVYLNERRAEQGLPVKEQDRRPERSYTPERG